MPPSHTTSHWSFVKKLDASGYFAKDISVVKNTVTGKLAVRKQFKFPANTNAHEFSIMKRLSGHPNIVEAYEFVRGDTTGAHDELYMQYCKVHCKPEDISTLHQLGDYYKTVDLPEAFAWSLLIDAMSGIVFIRFGIRDVTVSDQPVEDWEPIYHNDLHSSNIFLSDAAIDLASQYPRLLIGDWGEAETRTEREVLQLADSTDNPNIPRKNDMLSLKELVAYLEYRKAGADASMLGDNQGLKYSEDLFNMLQRLKCLNNDSPEMIGFLKDLRAMYEGNLASGKLKFVPFTGNV